MKNKGGRPEAIGEHELSKLKEAFLFGCTDKEAALNAGISVRTLYRYQEDNPGFVTDKETWKESPVLLARKTVYDKMAGDGKLAMEYLKHKKSDEFNTQKRLDLTNKGEKFDLSSKTDAELAKLAGLSAEGTSQEGASEEEA